MKICSQCEAINADGAQFCCKCGAQLGASQHGAQKSGYQPQYQSQQRGGYQQQPQYQPQPHYQPQQQYQPQYQPAYGTMGFGDAIRVCMKEKYASFEGRATRAEYWYFYLFFILVLIGGAIVGGILGAILSGGDGDVAAALAAIVYGIIALGFVCPAISVLVRRLHDTGRSGWWYWIALIPYIGGIVIFIFTLLSSQDHDNEYGPYVRY
ncbi:MAG: DUF805 domain-containing protein [Bacteroidales bacterium]|nr:DUF805 domain-containing protein [Bacteroidales bacterium]